MHWLPRSLLGRSVLLIALLLAASHAAWIAIFRHAQRAPRAHELAQQVVSVVIITRAALVNAQPGRRIDLLRELSTAEGIQVYVAHEGETLAPLPARPVLELMAAEVRNRLGPDTRITLRRDGVSALWVSFDIDDDRFWVMLPRGRIERPEPWLWVGLGAVVVLLSVLGAAAIVSLVNRPLRALTDAAAEIGRGREPPAVSEGGPAEVAALAKAFNEMASDLQRIDRERALMLAGVSHDLRTPLARIRLGIEMLGSKPDASLKDGMVQDIEEIDGVINQFLDFARVNEDGGGKVVPDTDLDALVARVVARYAAKSEAVTMHAQSGARLPLRTAAVERLLANLINNALRHARTAVEVHTRKEGDDAVLSVFDRGPGIPAQDVGRMLRPFTRLSSARTDAGSGLGLAIVERVAQMHGGRVELLPREGGGLEARVVFPLPVI